MTNSQDRKTIEALRRPLIDVVGEIDAERYGSFRQQLEDLDGSADPFAVALTTSGGDAEYARRIALDLEIARESREGHVIGHSYVYSAGVSIMASFPKEHRWLSRDCILLIHERRMEKEIKLEGPIRGSLQRVEELKSQFQLGLTLEEEVFAQLVAGSDLTLNECKKKAKKNWYVRAHEALDLGIIAGVLR